ncbi:hypothetical protein YC2023_088719 [Brassica napus]
MKILNRTNRVEAHTCGLDVGERREEEEENKQRKKDVVVVLSRETRDCRRSEKRFRVLSLRVRKPSSLLERSGRYNRDNEASICISGVEPS